MALTLEILTSYEVAKSISPRFQPWETELTTREAPEGGIDFEIVCASGINVAPPGWTDNSSWHPTASAVGNGTGDTGSPGGAAAISRLFGHPVSMSSALSDCLYGQESG